MSKIEKQKENITHLLKLIEENPELKIVPMVDYEIVASDDFNSWLGGWGKAEIDEVYSDDERIYFRSEDEEDLVERLADCIDEDVDDEAWKELENQVKSYEWKKVIVVRIELP